MGNGLAYGGVPVGCSPADYYDSIELVFITRSSRWLEKTIPRV